MLVANQLPASKNAGALILAARETRRSQWCWVPLPSLRE
jgi:hypothetical protein